MTTRWKAAVAAGVNLIATDQYEDFQAESSDAGPSIRSGLRLVRLIR